MTFYTASLETEENTSRTTSTINQKSEDMSGTNTNSDGDGDLESYRIEIYIGRATFCFDRYPEDFSDFEALENLAREHTHPDYRGNKLKIVWKDEQETEIRINNDRDLRESIAAQTSDGLNVLRFFPSLENKRRFASLQSPIEEKEKGEAEEKGEGEKVNTKQMAIVRHWCAEAVRRNISPLFLACDDGDIEAAQALLKCTYGMVKNENNEVRYFMRKMGEHVNKAEKYSDDYTPLHVALYRDRLDIMSLLISEGADIELPLEDEQMGLLNMAALQGLKKYVTLLVAQKANLETRNTYGMTPLHMAIEQRNADYVSFIIHQKADLEARDNNGWTPLHLAINHGRTETTSILIAFKADIEARNGDQNTPLHMAAQFRRIDIVKILMELKADVETKNKHGKTPFDVTNDQAIKALLQEAQGNARIKKANKRAKTPSVQTRVQTRSQTKREK